MKVSKNVVYTVAGVAAAVGLVAYLCRKGKLDKAEDDGDFDPYDWEEEDWDDDFDTPSDGDKEEDWVDGLDTRSDRDSMK